MTTLPEEAVKAADIIQVITDLRLAILQDDDEGLAEHAEPMIKAKELVAKLSALPFLSVQGAVKADAIKLIERMAFGYEVMFEKLCHISGTSGADQSWYRAKAREATERLSPLHSITTESNKSIPGDCKRQYQDFMSRILSALEPSAARELALEEHLHAIEQQLAINLGYFHDEKRFLLETLQAHITTRIAAIRVLSSPDHADAGKVERDGWRPITDGLNAIGFEIGGGYVLKLSYDSLDQYEAARTAIRSALPSAPTSEGAE